MAGVPGEPGRLDRQVAGRLAVAVQHQHRQSPVVGVDLQAVDYRDVGAVGGVAGIGGDDRNAARGDEDRAGAEEASSARSHAAGCSRLRL